MVFGLGCAKEGVAKQRLLGTWRMTNVVNSSGMAIEDRTTYLPDDSVIVERYIDGKRGERYALNYELDTILKTIRLYRDEQAGKKFEIVQLTTDELRLKDRQTGKTVCYARTTAN